MESGEHMPDKAKVLSIFHLNKLFLMPLVLTWRIEASLCLNVLFQFMLD
jgi:hypothetical protein